MKQQRELVMNKPAEVTPEGQQNNQNKPTQPKVDKSKRRVQGYDAGL